jgi:hydrogenase nickel incorporation protein HypA/HybF
MHEFSIVQALMEQCEQLAQENSATQITKVVIKVGVMSGVEPELLKTAYDTFKEGSICDSAPLVMNIQNVILQCNMCSQKSELSKRFYRCNYCQSPDVDVLDGEDLYLMRLEMQ